MTFEPRYLKDEKFNRSHWIYAHPSHTLEMVRDPDYFGSLFNYDGMRDWVREGDLISLNLGDCRAEGRVRSVDPVLRRVELFIFEGTVDRKAGAPQPRTNDETKRAAPATPGRAA